ncbi:hypothetical protein HK104_006300, partial [Borealophlyctis nickersoniae]
ISLCPRPVVEAIFSTFCLADSASPDAAAKGREWLNARNEPDGETPLHLGAKLGRLDVVELLCKGGGDGLDDTVRDADGKTPEDGAKNEKIAAALIAHRNRFAQDRISKVRQYLSAGSAQAIIDLFRNDARAAAYLSLGWIDINAPIDPETERSILHVAAKLDNLDLVNWALAQGADPGVKDRKGKKPAELCPKKDSRTKERLKKTIAQAPIISASLAQATSSTSGHPGGPQSAPTLRGNLFKWTNYAAGYKSRYFVLEHGNLSYFKSPADYPLACRGSIATMIANVVMPDSNDKSRFDVIGKGSVEYSLKARSPADAKKWVWALMESKKWMLDRLKEGPPAVTVQAEEASSWDGENSEDEKVGASTESLKSGATTENLHHGSLGALETGEKIENKRLSVAEGGEGGPTSAGTSAASFDLDRNSVAPSQKGEDHDTVHTTSTDDIRTLIYLLNVQMDVQQRVVEAVVDAVGSDESESARRARADNASSGEMQGVDLKTLPSLLKSSTKHVQDTIAKLIKLSESRERYWSRKLKREVESRKRWEEVVRKVVGVEGDMGAIAGGEAARDSGVSGATSAAGRRPSVDSSIDARSLSQPDRGEDTFETDEDVFYDAEDAGGAISANIDGPKSGFIEQVFGFEEM